MMPKMMRLTRRVMAGAALATALAFATDMQAQQTFFGEDLHGSPFTRLADWPNALNAQSAFLAMLQGVGTESFESFAHGTGGPLNLTFPGAGDAVLTGNVQVRTLASGSEVGRYPTDGNNFLQAVFGPTTTQNFRIDFASSVAAFGFMGTDIGDFGSQLRMVFHHAGGGTSEYLPPHDIGTGQGSPSDGGVMFFGLVDAANPFVAVEFTAAFVGSSDDFFGFDEMTIGSVEQVLPGTPVPEPTSMLLMATGLLGIAAARRRREFDLEAQA